MPKLAEKLKGVKTGPLWAGPEGEGPNGGITQSLIGKWLECKERFRVKVIEGWKGNDSFQKALHYGNMWHTCEEMLAGDPSSRYWELGLKTYVQELNEQYPTQQEEIDHWYRTCKTQFPVYIDYWAKHKDVEQRTPLMQEQVFDVPYELPSGRVVRLRGKFDSVDLIGKGKLAGIYLQENKTKGTVDRADLEKQLLWDLQTQLYLIALERFRDPSIPIKVENLGNGWKQSLAFPIKGVRYNVVRRPFSGGRGSIKRKEGSKNVAPETKDQFYARLCNDYFKAEPEYWFMRWKSEVSPEDVRRFRKECLDPLLEAICWWYDCQTGRNDGDLATYGVPDFHWRHPYGVKNYIDEGYGSDVDGYIETGSTVGLTKATTLFPELQS